MAAIIKYQDRIHKEIQVEKLTISLERQRLKEELEHFRAVQSPPSSVKTPQLHPLKQSFMVMKRQNDETHTFGRNAQTIYQYELAPNLEEDQYDINPEVPTEDHSPQQRPSTIPYEHSIRQIQPNPQEQYFQNRPNPEERNREKSPDPGGI